MHRIYGSAAGIAAPVRRRWLPIAGLAVVLLLDPARLPAQGQLSDLIPNLMGLEIVLRQDPADDHAGHFSGSGALAGRAINESIVAQLASAPPVSSSAGGFVYEFDPVQATWQRRERSFGPIFAERADTIGKGKFNFGISFHRFEFDSLDDISLTNGELSFDLLHVDSGNDGLLAPFREGDLVNARTLLELESTTTSVFVTWGLAERIDLAFVVPFVSVDVRARVDATVRQLSTSELRPETHRFPGGGTTADFQAAGEASGIGDVIARVKYKFKELEDLTLAATGELRLPTGREQDLLGTGDVQARLLLIASTKFGAISPHLNTGYTLSAGDLPDEWNFTVGLDAALSDRLTAAVDLLWRTQLDSIELQKAGESHVFLRCPPADCTERNLVAASTPRDTLVTREDDQNIAFASFGVKFNPKGKYIVSANLLYSLTSDGLRDRDLVPLIGLDYSF